MSDINITPSFTPGGGVDYRDPSICAEDVPITQRISGRQLCGLPKIEDSRAQEFIRLPLQMLQTDCLPPISRLWVVLRWAYCVRGPDEDGGWVRFSKSIYQRARLDDYQVRRRVVRMSLPN